MSDQWKSWAAERAADLQIDLTKLLTAHDIVCGAVGSGWLNEQAARLGSSGRTVADAHPLYRELTASTDTALVEICELAEYLVTFKDDPTLPEVIKDLRSDKYASTRFELAMAYRWKQAGAVVELQPLTERGAADFAATISQKRFVVEASIFPDDVFSQSRLRVPMIVIQAVHTAVQKRFPVALKLIVREIPPGNFQEMLRKDVREACELLAQRIETNDMIPVAADTGYCTIHAEMISETTEENPFGRDEYMRIVDTRPHGWDVCVSSVEKSLPPGELQHKILDDPGGRETVRVFLKLPTDSSDPYERVIKKLRKEARQLHGITDPRVVLLDVSGVEADIFDLNFENLRDGLLKAMKDTPELAQVWFTSRGWTTSLRHQYRVVWVPNPESVYQVPESFIAKIAFREWSWDFLGERALATLTEDEAQRVYVNRSRFPAGH